MLCGALVLSLGEDQGESVCAGKHQEIHPKVFHILPKYLEDHGAGLMLDVFGQRQLC